MAEEQTACIGKNRALEYQLIVEVADLAPARYPPTPTSKRSDGVVRSAVGWAHVERILDRTPPSGMRGPTPLGTRPHPPIEDVVRLLAATADVVERAAVHRVVTTPRSSRLETSALAPANQRPLRAQRDGREAAPNNHIAR
jgi:hypothetical protein